MNHVQWFLLIGMLLLIVGFSPTLRGRLPVTSAIIYLAVGLLFGPTLLDLYHFNPLKESALLEVLTEAAVLISLFSAGVKMPVPLAWRRWRPPVLLATASMTITVALVALFGWGLLGLPLGAAVLLGAIVAPTDPVLATDVQSRHAGDTDQLRFTLTCEAGLNDGTAFPFVMLGLGLLGLHGIGDWGLRWLLVDVLWATAAGVAIGVAAGTALAHVSWRLRGTTQRHELLDDFLGLGLIAVVYGLSVAAQAWGFLAVFFAAVALRQTELRLANRARPAPIERSEKQIRHGDSQNPDPAVTSTVSQGALIFKEHLERLSELLLVLLLGGALFIDSWSWSAVALALFLFFVARPLSVMLGLLGSGTTPRLRGMSAWFGVRGIGSLYYLMFAIEQGLPAPLALQLVQITLIVVALSVVLHGTSVTPLMRRFWLRRAREPGPP